MYYEKQFEDLSLIGKNLLILSSHVNAKGIVQMTVSLGSINHDYMIFH